MSAVDLSLVLACYNEETHLERSVGEILRILDLTRLSYEVIFVDDKSLDGTREIVSRIVAANPGRRLRAICHEKNTGRGRAVADGLRAAGGRVAGFIDVDLEVHPVYISSCYLAVDGGADAAVGRRIYRFTPRGIVRQILSTGYSWLVRMLTPLKGVVDTEAGYKFFRRDAVVPLLDEVEDPGWFWDTEIMVRAMLKGLKIVEVPCLFLRNHDKKSTVNSVSDTIVYMKKLLRFRFVVLPGLAAREDTRRAE